MKKIIILITSVLIIFSGVNSVEAGNFEKELYKSVILSKIKIEKEHKNGKEIYKKISEKFLEYRYNKSINTLKKLKTILEGKITILNNEAFLSRKERLNLNLYKHLYLRTVLLLDYQLKK